MEDSDSWIDLLSETQRKVLSGLGASTESSDRAVHASPIPPVIAATAQDNNVNTIGRKQACLKILQILIDYSSNWALPHIRQNLMFHYDILLGTTDIQLLEKYASLLYVHLPKHAYINGDVNHFSHHLLNIDPTLVRKTFNDLEQLQRNLEANTSFKYHLGKQTDSFPMHSRVAQDEAEPVVFDKEKESYVRHRNIMVSAEQAAESTPQEYTIAPIPGVSCDDASSSSSSSFSSSASSSYLEDISCNEVKKGPTAQALARRSEFHASLSTAFPQALVLDAQTKIQDAEAEASKSVQVPFLYPYGKADSTTSTGQVFSSTRPLNDNTVPDLEDRHYERLSSSRYSHNKSTENAYPIQNQNKKDFDNGLSSSSNFCSSDTEDKEFAAPHDTVVPPPSPNGAVSFVVLDGKEYCECFWTINSKRYSRKFLVEKYGYQRARRLAMKVLQTKACNDNQQNQGDATPIRILAGTPKPSKHALGNAAFPIVNKRIKHLTQPYTNKVLYKPYSAAYKTNYKQQQLSLVSPPEGAAVAHAEAEIEEVSAHYLPAKAEHLESDSNWKVEPPFTQEKPLVRFADAVLNTSREVSFSSPRKRVIANKIPKFRNLRDRKTNMTRATPHTEDSVVLPDPVVKRNDESRPNEGSSTEEAQFLGGAFLDTTNYTLKCFGAGRWIACWVVNGRCLQRSFHISQYGYLKAKELAETWRKRVILSMSVAHQPVEIRETPPPTTGKETVVHRKRGRPRNSTSSKIAYPFNQVYLKRCDNMLWEKKKMTPSIGTAASRSQVAGDYVKTRANSVGIADGKKLDAMDTAAANTVASETAGRVVSTVPPTAERKMGKKNKLISTANSTGETKESLYGVYWDASFNSWCAALPMENAAIERKYFSAASLGFNAAKKLAMRCLKDVEDKLLQKYYDGGAHGIAYERSRHCWRVTFWIPSKQLRRNKYFNISKHGWERAKQLAILYRQKVDALNGEEPLDWNGGPKLPVNKEDPVLRAVLERDHPYTMKYKECSGIPNDPTKTKQYRKKVESMNMADAVKDVSKTESSTCSREGRERPLVLFPKKARRNKGVVNPAPSAAKMRSTFSHTKGEGGVSVPKIWRRTSDPNHPISIVKGVHYSKREKAWVCRWSDVQKGKVVVKSFQTNHYGFEQAKRMAENLRLEKEVAGLAKTRGPADARSTPLSSRCSTAGYSAWQVHWVHEGKPYTEYFRVDTLGAEQAKRLATALKTKVESSVGVKCDVEGEVMVFEEANEGDDPVDSFRKRSVLTSSSRGAYPERRAESLFVQPCNTNEELPASTLEWFSHAAASRNIVSSQRIKGSRSELDAFRGESSSPDEPSSHSFSSYQSDSKNAYANPSNRGKATNSLLSPTLSITSRDSFSNIADSEYTNVTPGCKAARASNQNDSDDCTDEVNTTPADFEYSATPA